MATPRVTIDQLPDQTVVEDTNYLIVQDTGVTKKLLMSALLAAPSTALSNHLADTTDAHDATAISAAVSGTGVDAADVQAQLVQLASLVNTKLNQTVADGLYVNITGDTLTGPLTLAADPGAALQAATKQYVDQAVINAGGGITQADADLRYVNVSGDTVTGTLTVDGLLSTGTGLVLPAGEPTGTTRATPKSYVDAQVATRLTQTAADARYLQPAAADTAYVNVGGDTMTGNLVMGGSSHVTDAVNPTAVDHLARKGYVDTKVALAGDTMSGNLVVSSGAVPQVSVQTDGRVVPTCNSVGNANIACDRTLSTAIVAGQPYVSFLRGGVVIGNITIASATSTAYNTTSDQRLKERTGDALDAADLVQQLGRLAYRGRWIGDEDEGKEWMFVNSQDVQLVAPYAVQGEPDGVAGENDPSGREVGEVVPQQLDHGALVPLLLAALSQALDRIAALEAA
jgi:hypothetical protein